MNSKPYEEVHEFVNRIAATNLGPIDSLEFSMGAPGVTVLVAPNGSGKTILLEAVQALARGKGKLPLKDRAKHGRVEGFGATITIGAQCRHTGGFEVTNLEGRFDLAGLVDPQIQSPARADAARFKALVALTGVKADPELFRKHVAFTDFGSVVKSGSIETEDLVEMAAKIKDNYDDAALTQERFADAEGGKASALVPPADLDMKAESDSKILQKAYDEARDVVTRLDEQKKAAEDSQKRSKEASELLHTLQHEELIAERDSLREAIHSAIVESSENDAQLEELRRQAVVLKDRKKVLVETSTNATAKLEGIGRQLVLVQQASEIVTQAVTKFPTDEETTEAADRLAEAERAVERGVLIRDALKDSERAATHRKAAATARDKATKYRDAGKATDEVLSSCIQCPQLRIESDGKAARLVGDTSRGKSITFHEWSDGEKWTAAIDIGADQVGEGGLLVISQIGWEGIDGANRLAIHAHAIQRGVYILTAEASSDPEATREIIPTRLPDVQRESFEKPSPELVAKAVAKLESMILPKPGDKPYAAEPAKPKAAAKLPYKATPKPVVDDPDETPF